jgi:hypothetical protein
MTGMDRCAMSEKAGQSPAFSLLPKKLQTVWMFEACFPLGPWVTSKLTF